MPNPYRYVPAEGRTSTYFVFRRANQGADPFAIVYRGKGQGGRRGWFVEGGTPVGYESRDEAAEDAWRALHGHAAVPPVDAQAEDDEIENAMSAPIVDDQGGTDWEPDPDAELTPAPDKWDVAQVRTHLRDAMLIIDETSSTQADGAEDGQEQDEIVQRHELAYRAVEIALAMLDGFK